MRDDEWWIALDGWQFTSGDAPEMRAGRRARFPLEFRWLRSPEPAVPGAEPSRRHLTQNRYAVQTPFVSGDDGPFIDVGVRIPQAFTQVGSAGMSPSAARPVVSGRIGLSVNCEWWPGEPSAFLMDWSIREVLRRSSAPGDTSWVAAPPVARSDQDGYLVRCAPAPPGPVRSTPA